MISTSCMNRRILLGFAWAILLNPAYAYEVKTHQDLSARAAEISQILPAQLPNLGFSSIYDTLITQSIRDWIREGAKKEDDHVSEALFRYRNHFYDPITGLGFGGILWRGSDIISGLPAPDWALASPGSISGQVYSFGDARQYMFNALTMANKADRDTNLALMFRTLGNLVHLVQDMAQPQHTRNDGHANGSLYENYTDKTKVATILARQQPAPDPISIPVFSVALDAFTNSSGTGLAQYSNRNFVSAATNFDYNNLTKTIIPNKTYSYPVPTNRIESVSVQDLDFNPAVKAYCGANCTIQFVSSANDKGEIMERATTLSIFADDINQYNAANVANLDESLRFSLNRFNFDQAQSKLIPRAVGYSAGMLDYFFRGKIDMVPDTSHSGTCAIKNLGTEVMNGVFKLYYDDANGVRNPVPAASWTASIDPGKLSAYVPVTTPTPAPTKAQPYTLVFTGKMGQELPIGGSIGAVAAVIPVINKDNMVVKILSDNMTTDDTGYIYETWDYALVNSAGVTIKTWSGYMMYYPDTDTRIYSNWFCGSMNSSTGVSYGCDPYAVFSGAASIIPDPSRPSDLTPEILHSNSSYPLVINAVGSNLIEVSRPPGYTDYQAKPCK